MEVWKTYQRKPSFVAMWQWDGDETSIQTLIGSFQELSQAKYKMAGRMLSLALSGHPHELHLAPGDRLARRHALDYYVVTHHAFEELYIGQ